ncbi:MAG TPA: His/Gly/Thr/Pro-type tRNA ligase C-terminal domain-containing protein, partial [Polyangiaceae bacterium]
ADTRGGSLKSLLRRADSLGARLCLVLGDTELERGVVAMKDLALKSQSDVSRGELVARTVAVLSRPAGSPATPA